VSDANNPKHYVNTRAFSPGRRMLALARWTAAKRTARCISAFGFSPRHVCSRSLSTFVETLGNNYFEVTTSVTKGRQVVALRDIAAGTSVLQSSPLAKVLKLSSHSTTDATRVCAHCFQLYSPDAGHGQYCSESCLESAWAQGEEILSRCDDSRLQQLYVSEGRKFPLLVARLISRILCELKNNQGQSPTATNVAHLCFANFAEQLENELRKDYDLVKSMYLDTGIIRSDDFETLFPAQWFFRAIGSLQLNAFELSVAAGDNDPEIKASALLPGAASMFNHSCDPSLGVSTDRSATTHFVTQVPVSAGDELCISYIGGGSDAQEMLYQQTSSEASPVTTLNSSFEERRSFLLDKYGFECDCPRCKAQA